jgi:hypothetical protein
MTMAQFSALTESEQESREPGSTPREGTVDDWAMLASLPMGG